MRGSGLQYIKVPMVIYVTCCNSCIWFSGLWSWSDWVQHCRFTFFVQLHQSDVRDVLCWEDMVWWGSNVLIILRNPSFSTTLNVQVFVNETKYWLLFWLHRLRSLVTTSVVLANLLSCRVLESVVADFTDCMALVTVFIAFFRCEAKICPHITFECWDLTCQTCTLGRSCRSVGAEGSMAEWLQPSKV